MPEIAPPRVEAPPLPEPLQTLIAPPQWRAIDFLSDLHLAPGMDATLSALESQLRETPADAVVLLGDIFEVWVGDDARHDDFEQHCLSLLHEASQRRRLFFIAGNRDFLLGPTAAAEAGLELLSDPCRLQAFGQSLLLSHGDALCLDDRPYQKFRSEVRSETWQRSFLAQPLAQRRELARRMRAESERLKQAGTAMGETWADLDTPGCVAWLQQSGCQVLLHGHTHRPACHELGAGRQRWVLSDWDLEAERPRADVLRLSAAGLQRLSLAAA